MHSHSLGKFTATRTNKGIFWNRFGNVRLGDFLSPSKKGNLFCYNVITTMITVTKAFYSLHRLLEVIKTTPFPEMFSPRQIRSQVRNMHLIRRENGVEVRKVMSLTCVPFSKTFGKMSRDSLGKVANNAMFVLRFNVEGRFVSLCLRIGSNLPSDNC